MFGPGFQPCHTPRREGHQRGERCWPTALYRRCKRLSAAEAEAALGLPSNVHSYALLPIGYPMGRFGPVRRIALADAVYEDRWGQPSRFASMRSAAAHLRRQLILALAQIDDMS